MAVIHFSVFYAEYLLFDLPILDFRPNFYRGQVFFLYRWQLLHDATIFSKFTLIHWSVVCHIHIQPRKKSHLLLECKSCCHMTLFLKSIRSRSSPIFIIEIRIKSYLESQIYFKDNSSFISQNKSLFSHMDVAILNDFSKFFIALRIKAWIKIIYI